MSWLLGDWPMGRQTQTQAADRIVAVIGRWQGTLIAPTPVAGYASVEPKPGSRIGRVRFRRAAGTTVLSALAGQPCPPGLWPPQRRWPIKLVPVAALGVGW